MCTRARRLFLAWDRWIPPTFFHPASVRSILIITHLCLCFSSCLLPSGFPTKTLYAFFVSPVRVICPDHYIALHLFILMVFGEVHNLRSYISPNYRPRTEPRGCRAKHRAGVAAPLCCLCRPSVTSVALSKRLSMVLRGKVRFGSSFVPFLAIGRRRVLAPTVERRVRPTPALSILI